MAPSSLPHQEDPNKISLECGRDAGTAEHIWLDVASSVQIYSNCVTSDKLMAYPGILHTGIFLEVVGDKILVFDGNQKVCSFPSIFSSTTRTWCMTAQACSSEMGAEKEWRIWSRLRQSAGSSRAPRQPVSRSMSRGVTRCHEWSLCCLSSPLITSHP